MANPFFEHPILNSPYEYPKRHWELDDQGQPTQQVIERWITIDTSRVALALARTRIMGARYPFYLLADSRDGQIKEAAVTGVEPSSQQVRGNIRHGFVYERVPHITLKSIANNAEIDVIWDKWQAKLE